LFASFVLSFVHGVKGDPDKKGVWGNLKHARWTECPLSWWSAVFVVKEEVVVVVQGGGFLFNLHHYLCDPIVMVYDSFFPFFFSFFQEASPFSAEKRRREDHR